MLKNLISLSLQNRYTVLFFALALSVYGFVCMLKTPIDAIPDLSENQVIVFTEWMGRSPEIMEHQVTYPLTNQLQGIAKVKSVRGVSMFGMSFIYVIFEDNIDIYWARSRVLERLSAVQGLPEGIKPTLGADGTGLGHIFWYTLINPNLDLAEKRTLQDWYVKFALQNVEGVSEVASFGGFQKQYQLQVNPYQLRYYDLAWMNVIQALQNSNQDVGARVLEINQSQYIIRGAGYLQNLKDIENIVVANKNGVPILVKDLGTVEEAPQVRLGIVDENGQGEVVGGVVVMRYGENPNTVIAAVKNKIKELEKGLPEGTKIKTAYDRSSLIQAAIDNLKNTILEEIILVCLVIMLFLLHLRSALVVMLTIPVAILMGFIAMYHFGFTANIMSLSGIAIAIGVIVDDGIVMVENAHRHLTEKD
jgi:Cu(I)/Ag(I) efflux system membrane protein CusA/SilA